MDKLVKRLDAWIRHYLYAPEPDTPLVLALWALATHLHLAFDAFPYLSITGATKRCGKSRCMEILGQITHAPLQTAAATPATIYRMLESGSAVTLFIDEAERLGAEGQTDMGIVLNNGYRRGSVVIRNEQEYHTYGPKCFTSIGDLRDTARDRSIVVTLARTPSTVTLKPWLYGVATTEAAPLRAACAAWALAHREDVDAAYAETVGSGALVFLPSDRDQEIWAPLFAVATVADPTVLPRLTRLAVDLAGLKTAPKRIASPDAERAAEDQEYGERLLRDLLTVMDGRRHLYTADALKALHALPTAPWRVYRGVGLEDMALAGLLRPFGVLPEHIRTGNSRKAGTKLARGYRRADVERAVKTLG